MCFQKIEAYFSFLLRDDLILKSLGNILCGPLKLKICDCGPSAEKFARTWFKIFTKYDEIQGNMVIILIILIKMIIKIMIIVIKMMIV